MSAPPERPLVAYTLVRDAALGPCRAALYEYLVAGNGVFVRGERAGLTACLPVAGGRVRGLAAVCPYVALTGPRVPAGALSRLLGVARAAQAGGQPIEALFHLEWQSGSDRWRLSVPPQEAGPGHVAPLEVGADSSFARALLEIHSHHAMAAFWSPTDNADEQSGFRLYGVLGTIFTRPTLRLRVGLHGHFWEVPAATVCDLPDDITDGGDNDA